MPELPDTLDRRRHVAVPSASFEPWFRRVGLVCLLAFVVAALWNVFGQRSTTAVAGTPMAKLEIRAPAALRTGLIFEARFTVRARDDLRRASLVLDPGWFDTMTLNATAPDPASWTQRNGHSVLALGDLPAGQKYVLRLYFQANPTAIGRRRQNAVLEVDGRPVTVVRRSVVVYP